MNNEKLQHLQERIEKILVEVSTGFSNEYEYNALVGELGCLISKIDVLEGQVKELREAHSRTVEVVEDMLDRFTTEAVANPTRQDGHYAMVQL